MKKLFLAPALLVIISCGKSYRASTPSMEGTIKVGQIVWSHPFTEIKRNDIVVYIHRTEGKEEKWMHRVVGLPGDKIELRNGKLFVNDAEAPDPVNVKNSYNVITDAPLNRKSIEDLEGGSPVAENEYNFYLTSAEKERLSKMKAVKSVERVVYPPGEYSEGIWHSDSNNKWNSDNFGPIVLSKITSPSYFVMGDNRHNAMDSRYNGPLPAKDIIGIVEVGD